VFAVGPSSLTNPQLGIFYSAYLTGSPPQATVWELVGGALPDGLSLTTVDNTGLISGTPTALGVFNFSVLATMQVPTLGLVMCEKAYELEVVATTIPPVTLYWTLDGTRTGEVGGLLLGGSAPSSYLAGRINQGLHLPTTVNVTRQLEILGTGGAAYVLGQGVSHSFWVNWAVALGSADFLQAMLVNAGLTLRVNVLWQLVFGVPTLFLDVKGDVSTSDQVGYPIVIGQWDHIAVSYDAGTGLTKVYRNGALVITSTVPVVLPTSALNSIRYLESGGGGGIAMDLRIDEIGWWLGTTLLAGQVGAIYNGGAGARPPNVP